MNNRKSTITDVLEVHLKCCVKRVNSEAWGSRSFHRHLTINEKVAKTTNDDRYHSVVGDEGVGRVIGMWCNILKEP